MRPLFVLVLTIALFPACGEPPSKEMNQAQGAIDAAKAAGAETYAPKELAAATEALRRSEEAVAQRDYRLALSHAIDSWEEATAAAKAAVSARARARGDAERQLAEVTALVARGRERLGDPAISRLPRRTLQDTRAAVDAADKSLQEARTALNNDDYAAVGKALNRAIDRIQKANAALDDAATAAAPSRRRR